MNKRMLLASFCERTGATEMLLNLRRRAPSPWLPVLTFHRVAKAGRDYLFDEDVVDTTPWEFAHQIEVLRSHFNPVGLDEVTTFLEGGTLPSNPVLVTFDDGYRDNREVALPILRRHGVKAVFFIATDYLTRRRVFWWDRISYIVKASKVRSFTLTYPRHLTFSLATSADRRTTKLLLLRMVKDTYGLDLERLLGSLAAAADVEWTDDQERRYSEELLMTWDQVRELRAAGMEVQSHTRSHRVLQTLSPAHLVDELEGSRADLERELRERVFAISYPVGHSISDRSDVRRALRNAGYRIGFTNATGAQRAWRRTDPFGFSRMGIDPHTTGALFRARLALPALFE